MKQAQERLADALQEACAEDPTEANTGQLIKLEEVLAIANEAAKEAISLRRRIRHDEEHGLRQPDTTSVADTGQSSSELVATVHRVFEDSRGVRWNAFAVYPEATPKSRSTLPEKYQSGWLSFNSVTETRRVAPVPAQWTDLSDDALCRLCEQAEVARRIAVRDSTPRP